MALLNWDQFERLQGAVQTNFEHVCRSAIRINYERFGSFHALANQPGIEFDLQLDQECTLGKPGDWYGWQCRWYHALPSGSDLGSTRRSKIEEAIKRSVAANPKLTHWVLWTRFALTKKDQEWFYSLFEKLTLRPQLKTTDDLEPLLGGEASFLKNTYFGQLVLTAEHLDGLHALSVATIKQRWIPEVHKITEAEASVRRALGEEGSWQRLRAIAGSLDLMLPHLKVYKSPSEKLQGFLSGLVTSCGSANVAIISALTALADGNIELVVKSLDEYRAADRPFSATAVRKLRNEQSTIALLATNAVAALLEIELLFAELKQVLRSLAIAIVADAGAGKTHMAVNLTRATKDRPAGLLLFGQGLTAAGNIDDLAQRISICGLSVSSIEPLIAALDSAGQRSQRRLPLVIDGLNEAEDPRRWKPQLAAAVELLKRYPHVLLVCTVRSKEFADESLPDNFNRIVTTGFEKDAPSVARKYFEYFKIDARDVDLPEEMLQHPLSLRLFCEVANPKRSKVVGLEAVPGSLTEMFAKLIDATVDRIQQLSLPGHRYYSQDVLQALNQLGQLLWTNRARSVDEAEFRKLIRDDTRPWDRSIVRALEQEGIILRVASRAAAHRQMPPVGRLGKNSVSDDDALAGGERHIALVYDAMAGHVIAEALAIDRGRREVSEWLGGKDAFEGFAGSAEQRHPLGGDIFYGMVGVLPARYPGCQVWALIDPRLKASALVASITLVAKSLDESTAGEVKSLMLAGQRLDSVFAALRSVRSAIAHPLNADFLDGVLREMGTPKLDLSWSEWLRRHHADLLADVRALQQDWQATTRRQPADHLRARWTMWLFTTTVRDLRDEATKALYWYGRNAPFELLSMALESLSISDPYVPERALAALYGAAMAIHNDPAQDSTAGSFLPEAARKLHAAMFSATAPLSTTHMLLRDYARHVVELGFLHDPECLSGSEIKAVRPPFPDMPRKPWQSKKDDFEGSYRGPIRMDFGNYTIGRLVPGRGNYQYNHPEYQEVMA